MPVHSPAEQMAASPPGLLHRVLLPNLASERLVRKGGQMPGEKEYIYPLANVHHLAFIGICFVWMMDGNLVKLCK